jgi:hypothetical protein
MLSDAKKKLRRHALSNIALNFHPIKQQFTQMSVNLTNGTPLVCPLIQYPGDGPPARSAHARVPSRMRGFCGLVP